MLNPHTRNMSRAKKNPTEAPLPTCGAGDGPTLQDQMKLPSMTTMTTAPKKKLPKKNSTQEEATNQEDSFKKEGSSKKKGSPQKEGNTNQDSTTKEGSIVGKIG